MKIDRAAISPQSNESSSLSRESPLWKAAEGMEANFLKEMMRNLRKTVQESPEMENDKGYQIFRGMLDDQYAEKAAKTQGIGLAEIIVKQVLEQSRAREMNVPVRALNKSDVIKD